jgi:4-hydroxybenzoate polyprenyltransferase
VPAALRIAFLSHLLAIGGLFGLWWVAGLGSVFLIGSVLISMLLLYQHRVVRPDDLGRVNVAFFNVNAVVSMGVLLLGAVDLWVQS